MTIAQVHTLARRYRRYVREGYAQGTRGEQGTVSRLRAQLIAVAAGRIEQPDPPAFRMRMICETFPVRP